MIYQVSVSSVTQFEGSKFKPNKRGVWPLILNSINGAVLPEHSSVLDGSIAESVGIKAGNTYSLFITSREDQKIGDKVYKNYNYAVVADITASLGVQLAAAAIGSITSMFAPTPAQVVVVPAPEPKLIADGSLNLADMSVKELTAFLKAKKDAEKAAAEADSQPF